MSPTLIYYYPNIKNDKNCILFIYFYIIFKFFDLYFKIIFNIKL